MPLPKNVLSRFMNPTFIETGTYQTESVELALALGFKTIYTVDVDQGFAQSAIQKYKDRPNIHAFHGDSAAMLRDVLPTINTPITFWLDAHPLITPMPLFDPQFPLLRELLELRLLLDPGKPHVILMDDMRTFGASELEMLKFAMKQLWPEATHEILPSVYAAQDIYCCVLRPGK